MVVTPATAVAGIWRTRVALIRCSKRARSAKLENLSMLEDWERKIVQPNVSYATKLANPPKLSTFQEKVSDFKIDSFSVLVYSMNRAIIFVYEAQLVGMKLCSTKCTSLLFRNRFIC